MGMQGGQKLTGWSQELYLLPPACPRELARGVEPVPVHQTHRWCFLASSSSCGQQLCAPAVLVRCWPVACSCASPTQVRDLIYREILEYHPHMLADYLAGGKQQASFMYPSAVDNFKRQFAHLEAGGAGARMGANANLGQVCNTGFPMRAASAAAPRKAQCHAFPSAVEDLGLLARRKRRWRASPVVRAAAPGNRRRTRRG